MIAYNTGGMRDETLMGLGVIDEYGNRHGVLYRMGGNVLFLFRREIMSFRYIFCDLCFCENIDLPEAMGDSRIPCSIEEGINGKI